MFQGCHCGACFTGLARKALRGAAGRTCDAARSPDPRCARCGCRRRRRAGRASPMLTLTRWAVGEADVLVPLVAGKRFARDSADACGNGIGIRSGQSNRLFVAAYRKRPAIGAEGDGVYHVREAGQGCQRVRSVALREVPQPHGLVGATGGEGVPVGAERGRVNTTGWACEPGESPRVRAVVDVP